MVALQSHKDAVQRLSKVPGYGVHSAQQVIAEVGPEAVMFPSAEQMSSCVGTCPEREESAGVSKGHAPHFEPSGQCCREVQRDRIRSTLPSSEASPRTCNLDIKLHSPRPAAQA